ncbi:TPA: hypothetical protein JWK76_005018 [Escherichia coli]|uniref:Uncharacterized protein n=1 Tax=Escherichia albertii TaxID=208962 RepID=A0AAX3MS01_ESCAL|nr:MULTISPECIES: hypothetical protein [Escherichia]EES3797572.1 hypothetical protein [Escherichia coli]EFC9846469.1 hypothetical protein [Escherichia coli]EFG2178928.1 hypothetical protein [Escherichia coli]EFJ5716996.1 hypothetical protein [Escherichia coli]EFK1932986.1 hypothetical protein [Escherichia coli]
MLMQHVVGVRYLEYYRATIYAMKHSAMPEIAKMNRPQRYHPDKCSAHAQRDDWLKREIQRVYDDNH